MGDFDGISADHRSQRRLASTRPVLAFVAFGWLLPFGLAAQQPVPVGEVQELHWAADVNKAKLVDGQRLVRHTIDRPGAAFLKPHFAVLDLQIGESLTISDASGRIVERLDSTRRGPIWGLSAAGDRLTIELELKAKRLGPVPVPVPVMVDRLAVGDARRLGDVVPSVASQKSLCGAPDFEDALCYQGDVGKWANMLATAGILTTDGGSVFWCTGVNVSPRDLLLTTESCLPDSVACLDAEFVFGYYRDGCDDGSPVAAGWQGYRCLETVASSPFGNVCEPTPTNLDFSLHRIDGDASGDWSWADPDVTPPVSGERLYMPQHADGRPLEVTHGEGADVELDGMTLRYYGTLDTESSSVGAPVFRDTDDRLVAMHHCGGCASPGVGNRGVLMADIRPLIEDFLCQPALVVEPAPASAPTPLSGNGDAVIDPGETWQIVPRLRNASCSSATTNISADFQVAAGSVPLTLLDTSSTAASLAAGETADGTAIRFTVDAATCAGDVIFDVTGISTDGGPFAGESSYASAPVGTVPEMTLLAETFDAGLPMTWTLVDGGTAMGGSGTWADDDPGGRELFTTGFMIADSEFLGPGETMDEELISPVSDTTGSTNVTLRFEHDFSHWPDSLDEQADVDVRSSTTSGVWTNLANFQDGDASGLVSLDLTPFSAADLEVRFRYYQAEWEGWWAIDSVELVGDDGRVCTDFLFVDGFESGDTAAWSVVAP